MRILIDLQGAQATHYGRGIGRYSLSLALALIRQRGTHEIRLLLNGHYPQAVDEIRRAVGSQLPAEFIHVWEGLEPCQDGVIDPSFRHDFAQHVRQAVIASIKPDVLLLTSLFEAPGSAALVNVDPDFPPTAVVLYDLIPMIYPDVYLGSPQARLWYQDRLDQLGKARLLLAISQSSLREAIDHLDWPSDRVVNISTACEDVFSPTTVKASNWQSWSETYGINRPFLMYTGGIDRRKNIERLIRAYAQLPQPMRDSHQLVIVCAVGQDDRQRLKEEAAQAGLDADGLVITGYVPEQELVALYNACKAFVFPSWHEGFGLPVLEAMRCGKAVIASNTSSLPEVLDRPEALFDPYDENDIRDRIAWVLSNDAARQELQEHARHQSSRFSWDETARVAIQALEKCRPSPVHLTAQRNPRLACVSPLPPVQSGISDYTVQLLKALQSHYEIDVIVQQDAITDAWILENCQVRTVDWFVNNHRLYDRVLYHFGNSHYHDHMVRLIERIPGVVVLHDFYLSGLQSHHLRGLDPLPWKHMLYACHGYPALLADQLPTDRGRVIWQYPCNQQVLQKATGVIVHSDFSRQLARQWYGNKADQDWRVIPLLREMPVRHSTDTTQARIALGLPPDGFVVCTFGLIGEHKRNLDLLNAFLMSSLSEKPECILIFVGANDTGPYGQELSRRIEESGLGERIHITGWTDARVYRQYLMAADMGVQLRSKSRGETSAAVLDCMSHSLPTVVNANGSMADLDPNTVWMIPDEYHVHELSSALETLWLDPHRRHQLGQAAGDCLRTRHSPSACALQYKTAIEYFHQQASHTLTGLSEHFHARQLSHDEQLASARAWTQNVPAPYRLKQLLVDVSELVRHDAGTGIQRVTRAILNEWLRLEIPGWRIEPVWATRESEGYRYARRYTSQLLNLTEQWAQDPPVQASAGDVFLGLDLQPQTVPAQIQTLRRWHRLGVGVQFVVYDLLPVQYPQFFFPDAERDFTPWLHTVAEFDQAICISRATRDALQDWLSMQSKPHQPRLEWFHLGADVEQSLPSHGLTDATSRLLKNVHSAPVFLMVGTLEPRKGHVQVLDAFENLWRCGHDVQLVIVGKKGWLVEGLVDRLTNHSENGRRLHWLQGVSDEALNLFYRNCAALIAASYAEGYGLPLIEAARHGCPVIARDIPVFREVAEEHAFFFSDQTGPDLSKAILEWLELQSQGRVPDPRAMHLLTWRQSAGNLLHLICPDQFIRDVTKYRP